MVRIALLLALWLAIPVASTCCFAGETLPSGNDLEIKLLDGERWWGGCVTDGRQMPLGDQLFQWHTRSRQQFKWGSPVVPGGGVEFSAIMIANALGAQVNAVVATLARTWASRRSSMAMQTVE